MKDEHYLVGFVLGDGMVRRYRKGRCEVKVSDKSREHMEYIATLFKKIYGVRPKVQRYGGAWTIRIFRRRVYEAVIQAASKLLRSPDAHSVGGLFDAEGDFTASKKRLRFTNSNLSIVNMVSKYIGSIHDVNYHVYTRRREEYCWYVIEIYGSNVLRLLPYLDLRHPKWFRSSLTPFPKYA